MGNKCYKDSYKSYVVKAKNETVIERENESNSYDTRLIVIINYIKIDIYKCIWYSIEN